MKNFEDYRESELLENLEYRGIDEAIICLNEITIPTCYVSPFVKSIKEQYGIEFKIILINENKKNGVFMGHKFMNQELAILRRI